MAETYGGSGSGGTGAGGAAGGAKAAEAGAPAAKSTNAKDALSATGPAKAMASAGGRDAGTSQRSDPRVAVDAFVKIAGQDREYVFRTRDLSKSGLFLYTKVGHVYPFRVGSTLQLELYDYDKSVACKVVVVRVVQSGSPEADKYPVGFGVRLVDIDDTNRAVLQLMLDRVRKEGAAY
jgi:hypothetical protein